MNKQLRKRHLQIWIILALLLSAVMVLAWRAMYLETELHPSHASSRIRPGFTKPQREAACRKMQDSLQWPEGLSKVIIFID